MKQLFRAITAAGALWGGLCTTTQAQQFNEPIGGFTVDNVVSQFNQIAHHGDPLGFHRDGYYDPSLCRHYQGVNRYNAADGTPYLLVSGSGHRGSGFCGAFDEPAHVLIVRMGSRPKHGERLRSNRLNRFASVKDTPPPANDEAVTAITFDGTNGTTSWEHGGDAQVVDGVWVVPMERQPDNDDSGSLVFIDVEDPENPAIITEFIYPFKLGVLGMTRDPNTGKYIIATSAGGTDFIQWWETTGTDLRQLSSPSQLQLLQTWTVDNNANQAVRDKWEKWQNFDLIRQTDGRLFLATADNTGSIDTGADWIRLFEVTRSGNSFDLTYRAERRLKMDDPRMGNAAAATGFYVSPTRELLMYATEHENNGPNDTVRAGEWRSYNINSRTGAPVSGRPWIELYWDTSGWDESSPNRSLLLEQTDFGRESVFNLDLEDGWAQEADSLRWWAPPGTVIRLFRENNWSSGGGSTIQLVGNGTVQYFRDIDNGSFLNDDPSTGVVIAGWHDRIRSVYLGGTIPIGLGSPIPTFSQAIFFINTETSSPLPAIAPYTGIYFESTLSAPGGRPLTIYPVDGPVTIVKP